MATVTTQALREQVAWACRILAAEGYSDLTLGHVSARDADGTTVHIKRKGVGLEEVLPEDVVEFDLADGAPPASPEMHLEAVLHSEVYLARPDVGAVVHGHPPYATAFSATDAPFELLTHDGVLFADGLGLFDETPELITDTAQGRAVADALGMRRAVLLRNHGVLVVGKDVPWAVLTAVTLERAIRLQSIAATLGPLRPIPTERARAMHDEKYQDRFVVEYWEAWIRELRRRRAIDGMPGE
jgi:ribulose-5-phosphate 4-epimerase/fuculose-1-phosphate aldolase